ncbi:hypothetical protein V8F20_002656 [Naviculisporaceae sp. PSN 640]
MAPLTNATVAYNITRLLFPANQDYIYHGLPRACGILAVISEFLSPLLMLNYSATTLGVITLILPILFYPCFPISARRSILPETILAQSIHGNGLVIGGTTFHALDFAWWLMPLTEFLGITFGYFRHLMVKAGPHRRNTQETESDYHTDRERQPLLEGRDRSEPISYSGCRGHDDFNDYGRGNGHGTINDQTKETKRAKFQRLANDYGLRAYLLLALDMAIIRPFHLFCRWIISAFKTGGHGFLPQDPMSWTIMLAKAILMAVCFSVYTTIFVSVILYLGHGAGVEQGIWIKFCDWVDNRIQNMYIAFWNRVVKTALRVRALGGEAGFSYEEPGQRDTWIFEGEYGEHMTQLQYLQIAGRNTNYK